MNSMIPMLSSLSITKPDYGRLVFQCRKLGFVIWSYPLIGVSGGDASGKKPVCDMIITQLRDQRVVLVNQVMLTIRFMIYEYNFDHPDSFDTELLLSCMKKLQAGQAVDIPTYDMKTHRRLAHVKPSDIIILEGILVLHERRVRDLMNMKIFVDADSNLRLARMIKRDTVEKGRDVQGVLNQYDKYVKPGFEEFVLPSKKYADIVIPRGADNLVAIDLIVQHIRTKLSQHDLCKIYPNVYVIQSTLQVVEEGLGHLPFTEKQIITPTGHVYTGVSFCRSLCGVSIIRSGESMENALRACCKGIKIGKILIYGEQNNNRQLIYERLPADISSRRVLLLDPILATGNSAVKAISLLISKGVSKSNIMFLNLIASQEGIHTVCKQYPMLTLITSEIDISLEKDSHVIPGVGEFADRYFGT
ncbi:uridine/cytidine kinase [Ranunculus cassubicifolius]